MPKPLTLEQTKNLKHGQTVYHLQYLNADGTAQRFRVNGKVKTWKRDPGRVQVPMKRGMYETGYIDEYNYDSFSLTEPPRVPKDKIKGSGYKGYYR